MEYWEKHCRGGAPRLHAVALRRARAAAPLKSPCCLPQALNRAGAGQPGLTGEGEIRGEGDFDLFRLTLHSSLSAICDTGLDIL
jgi:hypothetical protein